MRTIEYFALVSPSEEESRKEKISKEQISKIIDNVFAENNQINNIIKNLGEQINNIIKNLGNRINTFPQLGFNHLLATFPLNRNVPPNDVFDLEQTAFGNFLEIGRMSNINGKFIGKFNFFYFNGESDIDVKLNADIKNESYVDTDTFDYEYLLKKFADKKLNVLKSENIKATKNINFDVPRFYDVLFLSNISSTTGKLIINLSAPLLIIIHNSNINSNIKYWAPKYENTECPKLDCPKIVCPKFECPKVECPTLECPKVDCPKVDCPKVDCPKIECAKVECPDNSQIYIGVIISLLLVMFILTYLYLTKKETN